mmetsp:Transcript_44269/g.128010  ORF Transcript_44269/g.128010 Transcript_44269/m.128010 type:complete len:153 (+) Transcript_44269:87-545(+)
MAFTNSKILLVIFLLFAKTHGFSLSMIAPLPHKTSSSSTQLSYQRSNEAESSSTITLDPSTVVKTRTSKKNRPATQTDPIESIAFLNDPERRYKKHRRPRALSDYDREKRAFAKAVVQQQAKKKFQEGQKAAEQAIMAVLKEYDIQDPCIAP